MEMRFSVQPMTRKKAAIALISALAVSLCLTAARAAGYGPYSYISHEVSASYAQTSRNIWTWRFLNNSNTTTITYMAFKYVDKDGEHNAVLSVKLKPGASSDSGFKASSRPSITIKKIKREPAK